jgi:hypothetical protein
LGDKIEENEVGGECGTYERGEVYTGLWYRDLRERKRQLGRCRRRCEDNIKIGLKEVGWRGKDWIVEVQDRDSGRALVNAVMNLRGT